jgi:hypothetical protein
MDEYEKQYPIDPVSNEGLYDDMYYYEQMNAQGGAAGQQFIQELAGLDP